MSDHINELDHENKVLRNQNDTLNQDLYQLNIDLANYKETLKKFYVHYCEQMKQKVNL